MLYAALSMLQSPISHATYEHTNQYSGLPPAIQCGPTSPTLARSAHDIYNDLLSAFSTVFTLPEQEHPQA